MTLAEYGITLVLALSVGDELLSSLGDGVGTNMNDAAAGLAAR